MTEINWDEVIADKVAAKVLDKIGDPLRMPPTMSEHIKQNMLGNDIAWYMNPIYLTGTAIIQCHVIVKPRGELCMQFRNECGDILWNLDLHSLGHTRH